MKKVLISNFVIIITLVFNFILNPTTSNAGDYRSQCNLHIDQINMIGGFNFSKYTSPSERMIILGKKLSCGSPPNDYRAIYIMLEPTRYFISDNDIRTYSNDEIRDMPGTCIYYLSKKVIKTRMNSGCR